MAKFHQDPTIFKRFLNWLLEPVKIPGARYGSTQNFHRVGDHLRNLSRQ